MKHYKLLLGLGLLIVLVVAVILVMTLRTSPTATPTDEPTPTPSISPGASAQPLTQEQTLVVTLSTELAEKYYSFSTFDAYLESVKPYLLPELYQETVRDHPKTGPATQSVATHTDISNVTPFARAAKGWVELKTTKQGVAEPYRQVVEVQWLRDGAGWKAKHVYLLRTNQPLRSWQ